MHFCATQWKIAAEPSALAVILERSRAQPETAPPLRGPHHGLPAAAVEGDREWRGHRSLGSRGKYTPHGRRWGGAALHNLAHNLLHGWSIT